MADKPTEYRGALDLIHEWVESEDDMLPEELEPEALAWMIRKLGQERDTLMEIVRLGYETCKCPHCGALPAARGPADGHHRRRQEP